MKGILRLLFPDRDAERRAHILSHAITNISDSVYITNRAEQIVFVNRALCKTFGFEEAELLGKHAGVLASGDLQKPSLTPIPRTVEGLVIYNRRKGGKPFPVSISRSVLCDRSGNETAVVGVVRDMTELKSVEAEKERLSEQLRQSQKLEALGILAGGIAHDFNNMLGSIIGFTELSVQDVGANTLTGSNLKEVLKAAYRARDLVEQILVFSRQTTLAESPIAFDEIVREVSELVRAKLAANISFKFEKVGEGLTTVADPSKLHQLVLNILTNAVHATKDHGGEIEIMVERFDSKTEVAGLDRTVPAGSYIHFRVRDSGHGIAPEILPRIFEPFFTTKKVGEGTGLGLSIIHGVVRDHGGTLRVASEVGKGTTFEVFLPCALVEPARDVSDRPIPTELSGRVLLVDDEESLVDLGQLMLERMGLEVVCTPDPNRALELFKQAPHSFDLVITDQKMPKMSGDVFGREVLRLRRDIPVIVVSGYSESLTPELARQFGFRKMLMKPLGINDLARAVADVLTASSEKN